MKVYPEDWEIKSLGELSKVKRGASPRPIKNPKWWGGDVGWVRISDVTASKKYLTKTKNKLSDEGVSKSVRIKKGELILSICATIGRPIIVDTDACIHDGFVWFENLSKEVSREYFYYFLSAQEEKLSSSRQIGTQGNLNTDIVSRLQFPLPPLAEQKKIANILSTVDEKIALIDNQIEETETLKKGLMQKLLTEGIGHGEFKDSDIGRIPVGWGVVRLSEVGILEGGFAFKSKEYNNNSIGYQVVRMSNINSRGLNLKKYPKYIELIEKKAEKFVLNKGDILITLTGTIGKTDYGNVAFIDIDNPMLLNQRVGRFLLKSNDNKFFYYVFNYKEFRKKFFEFGQGGTGNQANVGKNDFESIKISLPPLKEQKQIAKILSTTDEKLEILRDKKESFQKLKKGLMQKLLTGEVRVIV